MVGKELIVKIPPGISNTDIIILRGRGNEYSPVDKGDLKIHLISQMILNIPEMG